MYLEESVLVNTIEATRVGYQKLGDNTFMETWERLKNMMERQRIGLLTGSDWR